LLLESALSSNRQFAISIREAATAHLFVATDANGKRSKLTTFMADSPRPVKYRVVGISDDGEHVPICSYVSLEVAERAATLAQSHKEFRRIILESDDEVVRRAQF
jgi:hypothetical protein